MDMDRAGSGWNFSEGYGLGRAGIFHGLQYSITDTSLRHQHYLVWRRRMFVLLEKWTWSWDETLENLDRSFRGWHVNSCFISSSENSELRKGLVELVVKISASIEFDFEGWSWLTNSQRITLHFSTPLDSQCYFPKWKSKSSNKYGVPVHRD
jgi:hypothetical protein